MPHEAGEGPSVRQSAQCATASGDAWKSPRPEAVRRAQDRGESQAQAPRRGHPFKAWALVRSSARSPHTRLTGRLLDESQGAVGEVR